METSTRIMQDLRIATSVAILSSVLDDSSDDMCS